MAKVQVTDSNDKKLTKTGTVIQDFGRFVLIQFEHYRECYMKEDVKEI